MKRFSCLTINIYLVFVFSLTHLKQFFVDPSINIFSKLIYLKLTQVMDFPQNIPKAWVRFVKYWFTVVTKDPVRNIPVWTVQRSNQLYTC